MGDNVSYSIWGKSNIIVKEDLSEISDKVSERAYKNADKILFNIVKRSQEVDESSIDGQIANVISFLGKRGRGKTSAMLSLYTYLNMLQNDKVNNWSAFRDWKGAEFSFHTIDCIDAAMLARNEYIIDVILAKMWDEFNELQKRPVYYQNRADFEHLLKTVRENFVKVRKAYLTLKYRELNIAKEIEREREIPAASGLRDLATGINLKESIKELVENYIKVMDFERDKICKVNGYLVLAIDDVDMANKYAWDILEQIRCYMSVPKVIILITADMDRLKNVCEKSCREFIFVEDEISKFVHDYLEKVVPVNMRVYMSELKDQKADIMLVKEEGDTKITKSEKDFIFEELAKGEQLYFSPNRRKRHFLQNKSLRTLANYFEKLSRVDSYTEWLREDLQERLIERIEDSKQKSFIKKLLSYDYLDLNNLIINFIKENYSFSEPITPSDNSLGNVLYVCSKIEELNVENSHFVNSILILYTIILKECEEDKVLRKQIIGNSILGNWEYTFLDKNSRAPEIPGFETRMNFKWELSDACKKHRSNGEIKECILKLLEENKNDIIGWLYCLLYVNIELYEHYDFKIKILEETIKESIIENGAEKEVEKQIVTVTIEPFMEVKKGFLGFLFRELEDYKEIWEILLADAMKNLYKSLNGKQEHYDQDKEEIKIVLSAIIQEAWKKISDKAGEGKDIQKTSLTNSMEIIYMIGHALEREMSISKLHQKDVEMFTVYYDIVESELEEIDKYYKKLGQNPCFSKCFTSQIQVKLLRKLVSMEDELKESFQNRFTNMMGYVKNTGNITNKSNVAKEK